MRINPLYGTFLVVGGDGNWSTGRSPAILGPAADHYHTREAAVTRAKELCRINQTVGYFVVQITSKVFLQPEQVVIEEL